MLVLGMDLETTTFDQDLLRVTEVGAILYDTDLKVPIEVQADLVHEPDIKIPMDPFVVGLTGIQDKMVLNYGKSPVDVIERFIKLYNKAEYVVAHNGEHFDKPAMANFINRYFHQANGRVTNRFGRSIDLALKPKHWIDTMTDLPYSEYITTRKLQDLTGRHGFLNPFPHRAFTDVLSMMRIFSEYPTEDIIKITHSPTLTFHAQVDYHHKDLAKAARFRWNGESRKWEYKTKEYFIDADARAKGTLWDFNYIEIKE